MEDIKEEVKTETSNDLKFCKHCGEKIHKDAIICPKCGRQVEEFKKSNSDPIIINNNVNSSSSSSASASATAVGVGGLGRCKVCDKWIAFLLCLFLGWLGVHKYYEHRIGTGILYTFTLGLFGIGWFVDTIAILLKPNPYYVYY